MKLGFKDEAVRLMRVNLIPIRRFGSFIEQFSKNGKYSLFRNGNSDGSCRNQAWSVASSLWESVYLSSLT